MRHCLCLVLMCLCLLPGAANAWETYVGESMGLEVKELLEGNVFTATEKDGKTIAIRFYGIGIPTDRQPFGREAHRLLGEILPPGRKITVTTVRQDEDGIVSALVQVDDRSVNNRLVSEGLAWVDRHTCKAFFCRRWHIEEHIAQTERRGVWSLNMSTPPWQWSDPRVQAAQ